MSWQQKNRERYNAYQRKWRAENRERVRELNWKSYIKTKDQRAARRAQPENRTAARARTARYREKLGLDGRKDQKLRQQYGISLEEFKAKIERQGGRCTICEQLLSEQPGIHQDHDHTTGELRDVLCSRCNQAIGMLLESPAAAERLASYLRRYGK